jgi:hypothetical protein
VSFVRARFGRQATLCAVASSIIAFACTTPGQLGCSRFTEPCRLSDEVALFSDQQLYHQNASLLEGPSGETVLRFVTYAEDVTDAGAPGEATDAGAVTAGVIGATSTATPVPRKVDIVIVPGPAGGTLRSTFAAPLALQGRAGSTLDIGVTYTGQGLLFSWVEETTRTEPNGKVHRGAALRHAFATGADLPPTTDVLSCDDCTIRAAPVATKQTTFLFYAVAELGKKATSTVRRMTPTGEVVSQLPLPAWLGSQGSVPRISTSHGALVVRLAGGSYVLGDDLAFAAGPFVPGGGALSFVQGDGEPYAAWLEVPGLTVGTDGGGPTFGDLGFESASGDVGQNLMLGRFSQGGSVTRLSTASNILGVARDLDTFGVAFASGDREYFALAGAHGEKIGGDVDIGGQLATSLGAQGNRRVIRSARGPHTFSVMGLSGGTLHSREVSCE